MPVDKFATPEGYYKIEVLQETEITDKDKIRLALNMPIVPESFLPKKLQAIGKCTFKGIPVDAFWLEWDNAQDFVRGKSYPIFEFERQRFVIGKDGKGNKIHPKYWSALR
jgi:hypothetical protein